MLWSISTYISSNLSSIVLILLFLRYLVSLNKDKRLPKGPNGFPLLGYLPFLGSNPHYTLWKLGEQYGSIYTLPLGEQKIVILNDWDSVRNALRKDSFLGRPDVSLFSLVTGVKSLIDDDHYSWREDRKFFETLFRTCFDSSNIFKNLLNELKSLLIYLKRTNRQPIESRKNITKYVNNFFSQFIFGRHYISSKSLFDSTLFLRISILSLYPSWISKTFYKLFVWFNHHHFTLFAKFFRNETKNHLKSIRTESTSIRDLIDYYILEIQNKKNNYSSTTMSIDKFRANCQVFLSFGCEAFISSFEWSLISIAYFNEYQQTMFNEIEKAIGLQRIPEFKDEIRMPFTMAFLNEVLRWKTVLPFNLTRRSTDDATILGHFIPKDTLVVANIWAVHHDQTIWEHPFRFNPYRFLTDDGRTLINDHEGFMPFSLGKRSCVAETFVKKWLFIYIVVILQNFSISSSNGEEAFDEVFHLTVRPKKNVELTFQWRNES
ncbi:hypothetical protein DERP_002555 [Dermatophagoides pteronyssinus]|uniref:Uncharacterized protein n=1 Tax=Dermatophagoides pteronyssinus TaxID=6956 RepID=A0ABQ8JI19_DERPT|nr:hypothetical protein DERP_002555 [Dermatophagoides pteronyssinus]